MIRLHLIVEGQTEETFVNRVLAPELSVDDIFIDTHCITTSRRRGIIHRGGMRSYAQVKRDLERWMKQDDSPDSYFSTMIDFYGLARLRDPFPGWDDAARLADPKDRVASLEGALARDIPHRRFIPYLQLHEFEALIFSDPRKLDWSFMDHDEAIENLVSLSNSIEPEKINDGETTAPSKRIIEQIPEYEFEKVSAAPLTVEKIGLQAIQKKCPHFEDWIGKLRKCSQKE